MARTPLNEHCSAVILNKLLKKHRDPGKFLIPCDFLGMDECLALADLGASINLIPLSMWKKLSLPELTPTCMTLELADRSISQPVGVAEDAFVKTRRALIDVYEAELTLRVGKKAVVLPLLQPSSLFGISHSVFLLEEVDAFLALEDDPTSPKVDDSYYDSEGDILILEAYFNDDPSLPPPTQGNYPSHSRNDLPPHLEYAFLEGDDKLPVIIAKDLSVEEKAALIKVLKSYKRAIAWKLSDIKGGFTVVENDENELILTRLVMGWRVCIDYHKLNEATRKDHFPLPFMDQMLERLAGNEYSCFLDGFSGYFQIPIDPKDQEKTTFTCPYGTFAYRRMPFGLCNAPGTFQRCMLAIFHDMVKKTMEVFMDDFLVFGNSFRNCLSHLDKMLKRCEDTKLCLNWENSHFMVKEGIVLGHKISKNGIEVDKAKVDVIAKLPHPTTVKGVRSFLGHA
ncbi:reverse transcriptase domain-containing protein, partial [Tanacetum coccineum]